MDCPYREKINKSNQNPSLEKRETTGILPLSFFDLTLKMNSLLRINNESSTLILIRRLNIHFFWSLENPQPRSSVKYDQKHLGTTYNINPNIFC